MSVIEATRENFYDLVSEGTTLVDIWGPQCRPCIALLPHVEQLAIELEDVKVVKLEAPKARRICMEFKVMGLPAFLLLRDGREVARLTDSDLKPEGLKNWLQEALAKEGVS